MFDYSKNELKVQIYQLDCLLVVVDVSWAVSRQRSRIRHICQTLSRLLSSWSSQFNRGTERWVVCVDKVAEVLWVGWPRTSEEWWSQGFVSWVTRNQWESIREPRWGREPMACTSMLMRSVWSAKDDTCSMKGHVAVTSLARGKQWWVTCPSTNKLHVYPSEELIQRRSVLRATTGYIENREPEKRNTLS